MTDPLPTGPRAIHRLRGCFLGGPLHGQALPAQIRGPELTLPLRVPGETDVAFTWRHRRLEAIEGDVIEAVEFLVWDQLTEAEALAFAQEQRNLRGGWGEPTLVLPAAGFTYATEGVLDRDQIGNVTGLAGFGLITRLSPDGVAIALHLADESRALFLEEVDQARCEWCAEGIGHTLELHRARLAEDAAERRALRAVEAGQGPVAPVFHPLHLALTRARVIDEDQAYCAEATEALVLAEAHARFIARREAERAEAAAPRLILPAGVRA